MKTILDLGTSERLVVIFMPHSLYPWYPLERRLGGPGFDPKPCSPSLYRLSYPKSSKR
jgi:hypothetical protein